MKEFKHKCELFVLQCVPDALKGERVNVALVLRDTSPQNPVTLTRISERMKRIACLELGFDVAGFEEGLQRLDSVFASCTDFELRLQDFEEWPEELVLQPKMAVMTDSMHDEMELLASQYLKPRNWKPAADEEETRKIILGKMRGAFELAGVWDLLDKRLPVAEFTRRGDNLKLDCGYVDGNKEMYRAFHAVPLMKDCNLAKVLAYSWPMVREGISRKQKLDCEMQVIVSDNLDRNDEAVEFGWETMERAGMRIAPLSQLPEFAEAARLALHA